MSFLGGAECSTASNPLAQFTKHVQSDKSLQRDRLAGNELGGQLESFRSQRAGPQQDLSIDNFLQQNNRIPHNQPFAMDQMRAELSRFQKEDMRSQSPSWASEFRSSSQAQLDSAFQAPKTGSFAPARLSPADFQSFRQMDRTSPTQQSPLSQAQTPLNGYSRPIGMGYYGMNGMGGLGMTNGPMYGGPGPQRSTNGTAESKGKGRMVELDDRNWEQQFEEMDASKEGEMDAEANEAIDRELSEQDRLVGSQANMGDFENVWNGIEAERAQNRRMADELNYDFEQGVDGGGFNPWDNFDSLNTHGGFSDPQLGDYLFEDDNPFRAVAQPYEEGMKIMNEAGNLSLAVLAFEAAVQKDPRHVHAWVMLGSAQAQNEKESPAIRALRQAVGLEPSNLEALMGLAVSYTNESYDVTAYRTLEQWLAHKYPQILSPAEATRSEDMGFTERHRLHERVTDLFIRAAQLSPDGEHMDPDVQVGLGVLFYGNEEYDKAVDCFGTALASTETGTTNQRLQVHILWNRLGATLANSGKSEEAIAAYERALTINPNFVRARYNLGVSCVNMMCYEAAAQHLLGALGMHRVVEREGMDRIQEVVGGDIDSDRVLHMIHQNESTNLYETLRRVCCQMDRNDLADRVEPGMDLDYFKKELNC